MQSSNIESAEALWHEVCVENLDILWQKYCQDSQDTTLQTLMDRLQIRLHACLHRRDILWHDAEDIIQEAWLAAVRGSANFDTRANFYPWFFRILKNKRNDFLRTLCKSKVRLHIENTVPPEAFVAPEICFHCKEEDFQDWLIENNIKRVRTSDNYSITRNNRMVIFTLYEAKIMFMHYIQKISQVDIARLLKKEPGTISVQLLRLKQKIRGALFS